MQELWCVRTGEGLNAKPKHGEDDSRHNAEVAEPETKRRPVEYRKGDVESGTDGPVEHDDDRDDEMSECYRQKCLPPETTILMGCIRNSEMATRTSSIQ